MTKKKKKKPGVKAAALPDADHALARPDGPIPNLRWNAASMDDLRSMRSFVALPDHDCAAAMESLGASAARFARQESALWGALHAGIISTGNLADGLGFKEERVANQMGCSQQVWTEMQRMQCGCCTKHNGASLRAMSAPLHCTGTTAWRQLLNN